MRRLRTVGVVLAGMATVTACGDDGDSASVSFVSPGDGEAVAGGVAVELTADGVTIEPAGEAREGAGHFHVVADEGCLASGEAIPRDVDHVHLGQGQADGVIYLAPGSHDLCVQVGDGAHSALDMTDTITVEVGIGSQEQWCAVAAEVDDRFETIDNNEAGEAFPAQQVGYAGIGRLLDQMLAGLQHVDADARDGVRSTLEWAHGITDTLVGAADEAAAHEALEPAFERDAPAESEAAAEWILDTCDVDIDG